MKNFCDLLAMRRQQLGERLLERATDAVEIVDGTAHHLAARPRIEELQR
jgi:hypothetical protein